MGLLPLNEEKLTREVVADCFQNYNIIVFKNNIFELPLSNQYWFHFPLFIHRMTFYFRFFFISGCNRFELSTANIIQNAKLLSQCFTRKIIQGKAMHFFIRVLPSRTHASLSLSFSFSLSFTFHCFFLFGLGFDLKTLLAYTETASKEKGGYVITERV